MGRRREDDQCQIAGDDVLREFACRDGAEPVRLNAYVSFDADRARSGKTLISLSKLRPTSTTDTPAHARAADEAYRIDGPDHLAVGSSATYTLKAPVGDDLTTATWAATGAVTIPQNATGASITVTGASKGTATLTATVGANAGSTDVTVNETLSTTVLSILGEGWGSVITAIAILSVTAALGFAGTLNGQAVAGILGSLATYAIVRRANNN